MSAASEVAIRLFRARFQVAQQMRAARLIVIRRQLIELRAAMR